MTDLLLILVQTEAKWLCLDHVNRVWTMLTVSGLRLTLSGPRLTLTDASLTLIDASQIQYGQVRYSMARSDTVWPGQIQYGQVRYSTARYGSMTARYGSMTARYGSWTARYGSMTASMNGTGIYGQYGTVRVLTGRVYTASQALYGYIRAVRHCTATRCPLLAVRLLLVPSTMYLLAVRPVLTRGHATRLYYLTDIYRIVRFNQLCHLAHQMTGRESLLYNPTPD